MSWSPLWKKKKKNSRLGTIGQTFPKTPHQEKATLKWIPDQGPPLFYKHVGFRVVYSQPVKDTITLPSHPHPGQAEKQKCILQLQKYYTCLTWNNLECNFDGGGGGWLRHCLWCTNRYEKIFSPWETRQHIVVFPVVPAFFFFFLSNWNEIPWQVYTMHTGYNLESLV